METEELLYDSLDDNLRSVSGASINDIPKPKCIRERSCDLSSIVPLYDGEILKGHVHTDFTRVHKSRKSKIPMLCKNKPKIISKARTEAVKSIDICSNKSKKKPLVESQEQKSYVKLFHAKQGYPESRKVEEPHDTTRANDGDLTYRTATSGSFEYSDANSGASSDSERFYLNHMQTDTVVPPLNLSNRNSCILLKTPSSNCTTDLRSVTHQQLLKYSSNKYAINVPRLGGLGADIFSAQEKMMLLKKQRAYGQNASNKNRIKIMEGKIFNDLKEATKCSIVPNDEMGSPI